MKGLMGNHNLKREPEIDTKIQQNAKILPLPNKRENRAPQGNSKCLFRGLRNCPDDISSCTNRKGCNPVGRVLG